jgi:hypothetical protein
VTNVVGIVASTGVASAIPAAMREVDRWVLWRYEVRDGKRTKVPRRVDGGGRASSTDPATWATFEQAVAALGGSDGLGFVLGDGWVGVDLDGILDAEGGLADGFPMRDAMTWVAALGSYTERSPSGRGLHVIGGGELPPWAVNRRGPIEVYAAGRFFTVTGDLFEGLGMVGPLREFEAFLDAAGLRRAEPTPSRTARAPVALDDEDLLARAALARNGSDFAALYGGRWEGRYRSHSEADLALAAHLAFWTGGDPVRVDRLFRASGLMRPKWDGRRGDRTYGAQTVAKALAGQVDHFSCGRDDHGRGDEEHRDRGRVEHHHDDHHDAHRGDDDRRGGGDDHPHPADGGGRELVRFVGLPTYVATPKGSGEALIGDADAFEVILPAGGLLKFYGAQGTSKTTLAVDLVAHLASGTDWHDKTIARPVRVALIENEGPAEQLRQKLARKVASWTGSPWTDNVVVLDHPHGGFDFRRDEHRESLRRLRQDGLDVVVADPTKWLGIEGGGTPDEIRAFVALLRDCGLHSGDPDAALAFVLLHHENKAGEVSGAWGADPDTLVHVELDGRERTKLTWEKCRWSLAHHGRVEIYRWATDTAGFEPIDLPDSPQTSDDDLDRMVLGWLVEHPGKHPTTAVRAAMSVRAERTDQALERLKNRGDCLDLDKQSSPHDGRPRTPRYWIARNYPDAEVVPTRRTTTDDHPSEGPEAVRSRPVVPPIRRDDSGTGRPTDNGENHPEDAVLALPRVSETEIATAAREVSP